MVPKSSFVFTLLAFAVSSSLARPPVSSDNGQGLVARQDAGELTDAQQSFLACGIKARNRAREANHTEGEPPVELDMETILAPCVPEESIWDSEMTAEQAFKYYLEIAPDFDNTPPE